MDSFRFDGGDDDPENDEEGEEGGDWLYGGKTATIFLIDAAQEMFQPMKQKEGENEEEEVEKENPFVCSLKAAHATLMRKVVSNDQDLSAVVLFNTQKTNNSLQYNGVYILQQLERPGAEKILGLERLIEMTEAKFSQDYGNTTTTPLHEALRVCQSVFTQCKNRLAGQSILLFTCRDDPHHRQEQTQRQARNKARDLSEAGITLEILHLGADFDVNKFYKDLVIQEDEDRDDEDIESSRERRTLADPMQRLDQLMDRVCRLEHKQRTTGRVVFSLAPGIEMSVGVYTSISKMSKPSKVSLWQDTNEDVRYMKKEYLEETGELMMPSDFVKYQHYGGQKIKFTLEELKSVKNVYDTGIQLLGFKPITSIKPDQYVKPANFIYPDEKTMQGSTKVFTALLDRCLSRGVAAIVRMVPRRNSAASLCALVPQAEELDDTNCQVIPPGFIACYLPFADDLRNIELPNRTRATEDQVDAAKKVIKKLHFQYSPNNFDNPDLQTHWENVKVLALNRANVEPVEDYTVPDMDRIEKKSGALLESFKSLVYPPSYDPNEKIKRPASSAASQPKRAKPDPASIDVESVAKSGKADKLTVDVLKTWLMGKGVRVTGKKKAQLVQDVLDEVGV